MVRLAASVGVVENCPIGLMNEMLVAVSPGAGDDIGPRLARAAVCRKTMAGMLLKQ
jgi:hypothetical protein